VTDRDSQIDRAIAEYLDAAQRGEPLEREAWLAQHADLRPDLESFLADQSAFARAAAPIEPKTIDLPSDAQVHGPVDVVRYIGDYELLAELDRGGMGVVFRARQVSLDRPVAVKMILAGHLASAADVRRFRTEAEAAAKLDHPHILPIYEVGEHEGQHYFSMKLVAGGSLSGRIAALVREPEAAVALLVKVCRAVHFAHQRGILHRDLKPANVLLDADSTPYVTDFGLAKRVDGDAGLTQSGAIVGTPSYMAPEQARAEKLLTTAADVYALGAILYELLTGRPPFKSATPLDTLLQVLDREPDRPRALNPAADRDLETVALKCLQKEPAKRYESAAALADDLERWQRGEPIRARRTGVPERAWKWVKRRPALTGLLFLLALTGTAGVAAVVWQWQETRKQLYHNRVVLAQREFEANNVVRAKVLLDECPPGLRGWEWRYVRRLCYATPHVTFPRQPSYVERVCWSPGGKYLATAARRAEDKEPPPGEQTLAKEVKVWDAATGADVLTLKLADRVLDLAFSPDEKHLAVASGPDVIVRDSSTGRPVHSYGGRSKNVTCVAYSHDGQRLAAGQQGEVKVWDTAAKREVLDIDLTSERGTVCDLAFSADNQYLTVAMKGPSAFVYVWDLRTNQKTKSFSTIGFDGAVLSPDGRRMAWRKSEEVVIADANTGWMKWRLPIASMDWHGGMAFSPDGQKIAVGIHRNVAFAAFGAVMFTGQVTSGYLLEEAAGRFIAVYDATSGKELLTLRGHDGLVEGLAYRPNGTRLTAVGGFGHVAPSDVEGGRVFGEITEWDVTSAGTSLVLQSPFSEIGDVAFNSDGHQLMAAQKTNPAQDSQAKQGAAPKNDNPSRRSVVVWDVQTGRLVADGEEAGDWPPDRTYSPDRRRRVELDNKEMEGGVKFVDCDTGRTLAGGRTEAAFSLNFWHNVIVEAAYSPDGKRVAGACANGAVYVWDAGSGRRVMKIQGHYSTVASVTFSPDGRRIVTGSSDGTVKLWNSTTGQEIVTLRSSGDPVVRVAVSPDGHRIAAAANNGTVLIWDGSPLPVRTR
jgi:WD40 repeat protein